MIKQNLGGVDVCVNNAGMANAEVILLAEMIRFIYISLDFHYIFFA
jgi:NAD(P)-dependent dehydrogenase (short-subunit alcohol dehydrogenase family)